MGSHSGIALSFAVGVVALAPVAQGQVFKCKAADGAVTYTDVPCLRSESSSFVDTRANVADHSSLRKEATRLRGSDVTTAPPVQAPSPSPAPAPPPRSESRSSGYSR